MFKIAIIGSKSCVDKTRSIKEFLFKVKSTYGSTATILSGGNESGVEKDVKKIALEFGLKYEEYNPSFTGRNSYSALSEDYYKKGFHPTHFQHRYDCLLGQAERLIIAECEDAPDKKMYDQILKKAEKKGIKTLTI